MRLRRRAGSDHGIVDRNNGHRHEQAFGTLVRQGGLLHEAELLPRSYGGDSFFGKFHPEAGKELLDSLPVITKALLRRKVTPKGALAPHKIPKADLKHVQRIFDTIEEKDERLEFNLYISGTDEDNAETPAAEKETPVRPEPTPEPTPEPEHEDTAPETATAEAEAPEPEAAPTPAPEPEAEAPTEAGLAPEVPADTDDSEERSS
jgi:hypothetical protein